MYPTQDVDECVVELRLGHLGLGTGEKKSVNGHMHFGNQLTVTCTLAVSCARDLEYGSCTHKEVTCPQFGCEHGSRNSLFQQLYRWSPMEVSWLHKQRLIKKHRKYYGQHYRGGISFSTCTLILQDTEQVNGSDIYPPPHTHTCMHLNIAEPCWYIPVLHIAEPYWYIPVLNIAEPY